MFRYAFILSGYIKLILHRSQVSEDNHEFILTPISIMLEGLSLRFRFHFETSKPTNRIDKVIKNQKDLHQRLIHLLARMVFTTCQKYNFYTFTIFNDNHSTHFGSQ